MKLSAWSVALLIGISLQAMRAGDATSPIDYTRRNGPFSAAPTVTPEKSSPSSNRTLQQLPVEKNVRPKEGAAVGDRRAPITVSEANAKAVIGTESERPTATEQPKSRHNKRAATISPEANTRKPPTVARYQDSLSAASATNMARFPALDSKAKATINRFVFRKNAANTGPVTPQESATPAAGGSPIR